MPEARLVDVRTPHQPQAAALVLHGGGGRRGHSAVSPTQLSVLRMKPLAARLARAGGGRLAVYRLLNSHRGWDPRHSPIDDVRWALRRVSAELGDLPVALVGHSLGGRAALLVGGTRPVHTVVALNPWIAPEDTVTTPAPKVLIVHGDRDRVASPRRSRDLARTLLGRTDVQWVPVAGGKHAMLRHGRRFETLATEFVLDTLLRAEAS